MLSAHRWEIGFGWTARARREPAPLCKAGLVSPKLEPLELNQWKWEQTSGFLSSSYFFFFFDNANPTSCSGWSMCLTVNSVNCTAAPRETVVTPPSNPLQDGEPKATLSPPRQGKPGHIALLQSWKLDVNFSERLMQEEKQNKSSCFTSCPAAAWTGCALSFQGWGIEKAGNREKWPRTGRKVHIDVFPGLVYMESSSFQQI